MKVKYEQPTVFCNSYKSVLGQRPIWDWRHEKLLWIDVYENKIIETDQRNEKEIIPASDPNGRFVASLDTHLLGLLGLQDLWSLDSPKSLGLLGLFVC